MLLYMSNPTLLPNNIKNNIIKEVSDKFNTNIEEDIIDFFLNFQINTAIDEGFAKKETVKFNGLAVFKFNPSKVESKTTMKRLINKHNGNIELAEKEFKQLGKELNIINSNKNKEERLIKLNTPPIPKRRDKITTLDGKFSTR